MKDLLKWSNILDIVIVAGIVYLAANDKDGWGWLLLFLFLKN
jgi:hypothetical protein